MVQVLCEKCPSEQENKILSSLTTHHILYKCIPLEVIPLFFIMTVSKPFLQDNLTSMKYVDFVMCFVLFFFFKAGASWSSPLLPGPIVSLHRVTFPGAAERKRAHVTVFSTEVGIIFGNTHGLAGANGGEGGADTAFSFFVFQM